MKNLLLLLLSAAALCGQTTINGGRTIIGDWDASSAASSKPGPSGTTLPATCGAGQVYFKTDGSSGHRQYVCDSTNTWRPIAGAGMRSISLESPVTADSGKFQIMFDQAVTITRVACSVAAATSATINLDERVAATPNTAGTAVLTSELVCDTDEAASTTFSNATVAARVPLALLITGTSGTPGVLRVNVSYTVD